jgi:hypothetical protein
MKEIRCDNCKKLLAIHMGKKFEIKINSCQYTVFGTIEITCKCGTLKQI